MTITYEDWYEKLSFALHAYRTLIQMSIGVAPHSLVYVMDAIFSFEVEMLSLSILMEFEIKEKNGFKQDMTNSYLLKKKG